MRKAEYEKKNAEAIKEKKRMFKITNALIPFMQDKINALTHLESQKKILGEYHAYDARTLFKEI